MIFDYPAARAQRRHGPRGYARHESYQPWLRDEFTFRCAYCLKRENWDHVTGEYDIDHFRPQKLAPELVLQYSNLVYACRRCNCVKSDQEVGDPLSIMNRTRVRTMPDGTVKGVDAAATRLILALDLNSPRLIRWRLLWMRIVELASQGDAGLLRALIGFPADLPDLRRLRPPGGNERPAGIMECWAAIAERGELPERY